MQNGEESLKGAVEGGGGGGDGLAKAPSAVA
jgi:hypothetical protein